MTSADADALAALDLKIFGERDAYSSGDFFYAAQDENAEYLVAEADGEIIACAGVAFVDNAAEIETISVDPEYRRRGIGTELFRELMLAIVERGAKFVILEVRPSNVVAIKFYERIGFRIVDRVKDYYDDEDALIMMVELWSE